MAKASQSNSGFAPSLIKSWEAADCVNFAIALARITGWILEIDWWTPDVDDKNTPVSVMKSLRVHVADNSQYVYDVHGRRKAMSYSQQILAPLVKQIGKKDGAIRTRYYSEEKLMTLPLRVMPDESRIQQSIKIIQSNHKFLSKIPVRPNQNIPSHIAAEYTFGHCAPFAEAYKQIYGTPVSAMVALEYQPSWQGGELGYVHSFNMHPDGTVEDVWGKQTIEHVADRFGIDRFEISHDVHEEVIVRLKKNSQEKFQKSLEQAIFYIGAKSD